MRDPKAVAEKYAAARAMVGRATRLFRFRAWAVALIALSAWLAFVPGFDSLSYYFCLVVALVGSLGAAHVGAGVVAVARREQPDATMATLLRGAIGAALILAHLPLLVISLNALRVKVCDYAGGVAFWFVGPLLSMALMAAWGVCAAVWTRRQLGAAALFLGGTLASLAWIGWHFYTSPQIFAYSPLIGVYTGAIYDDVIGISGTLVLYRLNNAVQLAAVVLLTRAAMEPGTLRARLGRLRWRAVVPGLVALAVAVGLFALRGRLGWEIGAADIQRELGGRYDTEHVTIFYPKDDPRISRDIAWIAEDHEYRCQELAALIGAPHPERIESYVYASGKQRRRLMGADKVYVAKPWLHQIHLGRLPYGSGVLKHELAHVFVGTYAPGPLHVTAQWRVLPHMALVEGLATAIEWERGRLTPHQWAAAMLELGILPDIERIMGPKGYLTTFGGTAYTTAGSLVRWLIDERGMAAVLKLYGDGDFEAAFGRPMDAVVAEWKEFLRDRSRVPIAPEDMERARFYFDRKGVLQRVCPIVVAGLEREADRLAKRGEWDRAVAIRRTVLDWMPENPTKKAALAGALIGAGKEDEARELAAQVLADERVGLFLKSAIRERIADLDWRAGKDAEARAAYEALRTAPLDEGSLRGIAVKLMAMGLSEGPGEAVRDYLTRPRKDADALAFLAESAAQAPGEPLIAYLLGRRQFLTGAYDEAAATLARAHADGWPSEVVAERERMRGISLYFTGAPLKAREHLAAADAALPAQALGLRGEVQGWMTRCDWKAKAGGATATAHVPVLKDPSAVRMPGETIACGCD